MHYKATRRTALSVVVVVVVTALTGARAALSHRVEALVTRAALANQPDLRH